MAVQSIPSLHASGVALETGEDKLGWLLDSSRLIDDIQSLRGRLKEEGYLFLPGYLDRDEVIDARGEVTDRLAAGGHLDLNFDPIEAVAAPGYHKKFMIELAQSNRPLLKLLYEGRMMDLFRRLFDGPVRHFDYTWFRAISPGVGTPPHCDSVYMNRGSQNLLTAWTPIGDCTFEMGGLMILEHSSKNARLRETYCKSDVDSYCTNRAGRAGLDAWDKGITGVLSRNPAKLRRSLGGRWLTSEFSAGDLLIFDIFTVHGSVDNHSDRIRLSSDSRYQPASEPADERWIGENPTAHGKASKRGKIC